MMIFDTQTLVLITSIVFATQTMAVFVQYSLNKSCNGFNWWLWGFIFQTLGFCIMPLITNKSIWMIAILANPLIISGLIFLNNGILKFLEKKENKWISISLFVMFIILYAFFILIKNSITDRTILVYSMTVIVTIKTACTLYREKKKQYSSSANFMAAVFLAYGLLQTLMIITTIFLPSMQSYHDISQSPVRSLAFIIPSIIGILLSCGFIIMANQRLNADNLEEKNKLQIVFNTNPDAQQIYRVSDGLFIDVNAGFLITTGYTRDEIISKTIYDIGIWERLEDRQKYLADLKNNGSITNHEYHFKRKDGSVFIGILSAKIINMNDQDHIVSVLHDISYRIKAEQKIKELAQRLELEKNAAKQNSITDSLTGLMNRRFFDETLKKEFYRSNRAGTPLSLIILDIDYFKTYNDTYGHLVGDECLIHVGIVLKTIVKRLSDTVVRYGGEEFVVIMPETESCGAADLGEKIRKGIESLTLIKAGSITVSLGIVTAYASDLAYPEKLVELADKALYQAKKNGRNTLQIATVERNTDSE